MSGEGRGDPGGSPRSHEEGGTRGKHGFPRDREVKPSGAHATASNARVKSIVQFVSQVSPPSSEKACSQRGVEVVMPDQMNRTRIGRPSNVSSPSNTPVSPSNDPTTGGSSSPGRRESAQ